MAFENLLGPVPLLGTFLALILSVVVYRLYLHPLSHIPGPLIARISSLWLYRLSYYGIEASTTDGLHEQYGPVVRIAPNEVDISDGASLNAIYVKNGGFSKNPCYRNFDIDGFPTLFSALDPAHRAVRSKVVVGLFAPAAIREGRDVVQGCVDRMVTKLEKEKADAKGLPVNVLNIFRSVALDAVTAYLFHKPYNGIKEQELSASAFVDAFVGVGRFFHLPNWVFKFAELCVERLQEGKPEVWKSLATVDKFVSQLVDEARKGDNGAGDTYQARLLNAGISREETIAQCKDLIFAGTDSTGMNLSMICWHLVQQPEKYKRLHEEIMNHPYDDPQTLPYLSGVVKEGLRISKANPIRLPRVVSSNGLNVQGLPFLPPGTGVGLSSYTLHSNPNVFINPHDFIPERWSKPTEEMLRDYIPWGVGPRQCIARNLATANLYWAVHALVKRDVLRGASTVEERVEILEWFNSKVKSQKIELVWRE